MGLFSRKSAPHDRTAQQTTAIDEFWAWWATQRDWITNNLDHNNVPPVADECAAMISAIDPHLAWEFAPGPNSTHLLIVSAMGARELGRVARRWRRAAPPADEQWSFSDLRPAGSTDAILDVQGIELPLKDVRVALAPRGAVLDASVYHPTIKALLPQDRGETARFCLVTALGEQDMRLWIGRIETPGDEPEHAMALGDLPAVIDQWATARLPEGTMGWSVWEGQAPRGPVNVLALTRLSSALAPHYDQHVTIAVPYLEQTDQGFPGPASLEALRLFEDHLSDIVEGSGMIVAVESCNGVRTLHYYVDSTTPAVAQLTAAIDGWIEGEVTVEDALDPPWHAVSMFNR
jgi:hypothetical protein